MVVESGKKNLWILAFNLRPNPPDTLTAVACNDKDGNIVGGCQQYQQGGDTHERVLGQVIYFR